MAKSPRESFKKYVTFDYNRFISHKSKFKDEHSKESKPQEEAINEWTRIADFILSPNNTFYKVRFDLTDKLGIHDMSGRV
jgi:hypothetical protein